MTYIKLEDVQKIIEKYSYAVVIDLGMRKEINSLPSIDPQEMIREMIDNCWNLSDSFNEKMVGTTREKLLEELLNKLPK